MEKLLRYIIESTVQPPAWDIDWCTRDDFSNYCSWLWELNKDNFIEKMTYREFYGTQWILVHEAPHSFKVIINARLKKLKNGTENNIG